MFREPGKAKAIGRRTINRSYEPSERIDKGRRLFDQKMGEEEVARSGIRIKPTKVEMDQISGNEALQKDFVRLWGSVNIGFDASKHKYWKTLEKAASGEASRDWMRYGKYGCTLEENMLPGLKMKDKGEPIDVLDFVLYLRDENLPINKQGSIVASRKCAKLLFLHNLIKSEGAKNFAERVIRTETRYGSKKKQSSTNVSQIFFG